MKKRYILGGLASAVLVAGVLAPNNVFATERTKITTNYLTTIQYDGKLVDANQSVLDTYSHKTEEYEGKYTDLTAEIENADQAFIEWSHIEPSMRIAGVADQELDDILHTETVVTSDNIGTICVGVEGACEAGDTVKHTTITRHQTYLIRATATTNKISLIDLDFEAPAAGETNTVTESEVICISTLSCDEDSVVPAISTNTPKVLIQNALWQVKGDDGHFNRFEGTFEEGKEYYLAVEIIPDGEISLDTQANIRVNGEEVDDGLVTALSAVVFYKFTIQPDNPDTFDGIHIILGVLGSCTLAGSALFLSKAKRH